MPAQHQRSVRDVGRRFRPQHRPPDALDLGRRQPLQRVGRQLFPRVGFIVTNMPMDPDWILRFYNQRGTAEQYIKEGK